MAVNMVDPDKRDRAVAFVEAEADRLHIVRTLEKRSEPLTFEYFKDHFYSLKEGELYALLTELEAKEIISKMSEDPATWDLTTFGHEILYALEPRAHTSRFSIGHLLRGFMEKRAQKSQNTRPQNTQAQNTQS